MPILILPKFGLIGKHMIKYVCNFLCAVLLASPAFADGLPDTLVDAARDRTKSNVRYDGRYVSIAYPNGDVPTNIGVCSDVIIRAYRTAFSYDFQKEVHEDMKSHFSDYPKIWGLQRTDTNIDHRRVPNLETFLSRKGAELPATRKKSDYRPGDLVTWRVGGTLPHIGIVSDRKASDGTPLIIHNMGAGPVEEDVLFVFRLHKHFRYLPEVQK